MGDHILLHGLLDTVRHYKKTIDMNYFIINAFMRRGKCKRDVNDSVHAFFDHPCTTNNHPFLYLNQGFLDLLIFGFFLDVFDIICVCLNAYS